MEQRWYQGWGRAGVTYQPGPNSQGKMLLALRECGVGFVGVGGCRESSGRLGMSPWGECCSTIPALVWVPHPCCHIPTSATCSSPPSSNVKSGQKKRPAEEKNYFSSSPHCAPKISPVLEWEQQWKCEMPGMLSENWKDTFQNSNMLTAH